MSFSSPIRPKFIAGALALAMSWFGFAFAATAHTYKKRPHATATSKSTSHTHKDSLHHTSYSHSRYRHRRSRRHGITGQRVMDSQRATEIQQALIQAHYLDGTPTGMWDAASQAAMVKYQTDNGWQSKITPDSRALIKLGLGPKQDSGEYTPAPAGVSKLSSPVSTDSVRTLATSEMPAATTQN